MNEKRETETASSTTTATHFYRYAVMASDNINIKYIYIFSVLRYMYVWRGVFICGSQKVFPFHTHRARDADDCFRRRFVLAISSHMLSNDLNKEIPICLIYALWLKHTHIRTLSIGTIFRSYFASTQNPFFFLSHLFRVRFPLSFILYHQTLLFFLLLDILSRYIFSFSMQ